MFQYFLEKYRNNTLFETEDGREFSYGDALDLSKKISGDMPDSRRLLFLEVDNDTESLSHYIAFASNDHVVFPFSPADADKAHALAGIYRPNLIGKIGASGYELHEFDPRPVPLHPDLALLLSTSGSTGTPKFVKLSRNNLLSNARSIVEYLGIREDSAEITTLKPSYSYGLSIIHSHLVAGARLVLSERSVMDAQFWHHLSRSGARSLSGVPYTYELILNQRIRLEGYPQLEYLTQAGGKLGEHQVLALAEACGQLGRKFFVMYGQTEAAPRIAYVPPDRIASHPTCIGVPVPGGKLVIRDEAGHEITQTDESGELFYSGPNVMMGYALSPDDLATDETPSELATGDLGALNSDGLYYIVGRRSRFLKLFGNRISLDQIEAFFASQGDEVVCTGDDDCLIAVTTGSADRLAFVEDSLQHEFHIPHHAFIVSRVAEIPRLSNGKYDLPAIRKLAPASRGQAFGDEIAHLHHETDRLRKAKGYARSFLREYIANWLDLFRLDKQAYGNITEMFLDNSDAGHVGDDTIYADIAGDSLSYITTSIALSEYLGFLPDQWDRLSVADLESLKYELSV
jgi:hypothetical protein